MTAIEAWAWLDSLPDGYSVTRYDDKMYRVSVPHNGKHYSGFDAMLSAAVEQAKEKVEAST